jgi:hypothetical protein
MAQERAPLRFVYWRINGAAMLFSTGNFPRDGAPPPGVAMTVWTTRLPPERTRLYGVEELHCAWLLPRGFPGKGPVVSLSIPECEMKYMPDIEIAGVQVLWMFGRPRPRVAHSIKDACKVATEANACLFILADSAEQLEPAVRLATKRLPHHQRAALERMADPATRARNRLS